MPATGDNLRINSERLWDSLMEMAKIGPGIAGGNNRQTLTDADSEGRHLFKRWCEAAGMTMGVDTMGNMFATRAGRMLTALPVYMGSHLDTQPTGGKYDGVLGVLGALEVVRTMNDMGVKTKHPIVVTNWTNEEGARFAPAMLASGVFAGLHTEEYAKSRKDLDGKVFGEELARIGWVGDEKVGARKMHAMLELHIEQGPILEAEGKSIGVVTHGQGLWWLEITLTGKDAHTGSTPMNMRVNAGLGYGADHRTRPPDRDEPPTERRGRGGAGEGLSQLAQRDTGQGCVHGRYPVARTGQAGRDEGRSHPRRPCGGEGVGVGLRDRGCGPLRPRDLRPRPCEDRPAIR
jgi:beta-ureidopropionase / N-carbamoyl-L-amino-acid hydrolase